jgi:hypothetical protein
MPIMKEPKLVLNVRKISKITVKESVYQSMKLRMPNSKPRD